MNIQRASAPHPASHAKEQGVALVVALIFLLVVTVISVVAASNSRQGLMMTTNLQDGYDSFQSAEAGVLGAIGTAGTANDVFDGVSEKNVFGTLTDAESPIGHLNGGNTATKVHIYSTSEQGVCIDNSEDLRRCRHYRVVGEHEVDRRAKSKVSQGIMKVEINDGHVPFDNL